MGILATKLKNNIIKANKFKNLELSFHLKNVARDPATKDGCSGFVKNEQNGKVVYLMTDTPNFKILYRTAPALKDYSNHGINQFGHPDDEATYLKIIGTWSTITEKPALAGFLLRYKNVYINI